MASQKDDEQPVVEKKKYSSPELTDYGTLEDLTRQTGNVGDDGIIGSRRKA